MPTGFLALLVALGLVACAPTALAEGSTPPDDSTEEDGGGEGVPCVQTSQEKCERAGFKFSPP